MIGPLPWVPRESLGYWQENSANNVSTKILTSDLFQRPRRLILNRWIIIF